MGDRRQRLRLAATPTDVYLGGDFTLIGRRTGSWVRVDAAGTVAPVPHFVAGSVSEAVPDGAGGWFIAGDIESVGGDRAATCRPSPLRRET